MPARPVMKWPGGKRKIVGEIFAAFGDGEPLRWIEPFLGGASVALAVGERYPNARRLLSDGSPQLVGCYRTIVGSVETVLEELARLPVDGDWRDKYDGIRDRFNDAPIDTAEHAAMMLWLGRAGFNGLWRVNRRGRLNVSANKKPIVPVQDGATIRAFAEAMSGSMIWLADFESMIAACGVRPGDWIYLDPPYLPINPAGFVGYAGAFTMHDQHRVAVAAAAAARAGARVVISQSDVAATSLVFREGEGFRVAARLGVRRSISCDGEGRTSAREVLLAIGGDP